MNLVIMDTNFEIVHVLDTFESLIWTDRYSAYGDFEIFVAANLSFMRVMQHDYYIWNSESNHEMIIENLEIRSDVETGNQLIITGRSLESILDRRIIWEQTILSGDFQTAIQRLLNESIINPADSDRMIPDFIFEFSDDPSITTLTVEAQFTGDNLYDAIKKLCDASNIGFSIRHTLDNQFVFKLYAGQDRSYDQFDNPYVIFSPNFENLINSNYFESRTELKTVTLVAGEGEGTARKTIAVASESGSGVGLNRREMYTDARDISSRIDSGTMTDAAYYAQLTQRGKEYLAEKLIVKTFEGQIDSQNKYAYGKDFFMGDIIQIANEYGIESRSRVTEIVHSIDKTGSDLYPTFTTIE